MFEKLSKFIKNKIKLRKIEKTVFVSKKSWYINSGDDNNIQNKRKAISGREGLAVSSVYELANWFLMKKPMTHKKLQKLCYYAQAWSYALRNVPIVDTQFEAWVHGPVSRDLYAIYAGNSYQDILPNKSVHFPFTNEEEEILESVWVTYGEYTANALEALSHNEPPWIEARAGISPNESSDRIISTDTMRKYYQSIYDGEKA